jgi:hypothetical protein
MSLHAFSRSFLLISSWFASCLALHVEGMLRAGRAWFLVSACCLRRCFAELMSCKTWFVHAWASVRLLVSAWFFFYFGWVWASDWLHFVLWMWWWKGSTSSCMWPYLHVVSRVHCSLYLLGWVVAICSWLLVHYCVCKDGFLHLCMDEYALHGWLIFVSIWVAESSSFLHDKLPWLPMFSYHVDAAACDYLPHGGLLMVAWLFIYCCSIS